MTNDASTHRGREATRLARAALAITALHGCAPAISCGPGTILDGRRCVAAPTDDPTVSDAPSDDGTDAPTDAPTDAELTDPGFDLDTGAAPPCRGDVWPVDGSAAADPDSPVIVWASSLIAPVTLALTGPDGPVAGATVPYGDKLAFVADASLDTETTYTLSVSSACGAFTTTFTTNDVGPPVDDPSAAGTSLLDISDGQWLRPVQAGLIVTTILDDLYLAVVANDPLTFRLAGEAGGRQDTCALTHDLKPATWTNPRFELDLSGTTLPTTFGSLPVVRGTLSAAFRPDGQLSGARLRAEIDQRDPAVSAAVGFDGICAVLGGFGAACAACADGAPDCVILEAYDLPATLDPIGLDVVDADCP